MNRVAQQMKVTSKFTELGIPYEMKEGELTYSLSTQVDGKSYGVIVDVNESENSAKLTIYDEKADEHKPIYDLDIEGVEKPDAPFFGNPEMNNVWGRIVFT